MNKKLIIIISIVLSAVMGGCIYYFSNYDSNLADLNEIQTDSKYEGIIYNQEGNIQEKDILGILTIEKIGLKANVKEGSNNKILKDYIGHIEDTPIYDGNIRFGST